jgi:hypothetical protein
MIAEDIEMFRGAVTHLSGVGEEEDHHGTGWASAVAILFAVVAAVSFAVDLTISLSGPQPAANQSTVTVR